jgi:ferredoxin
MSPTGTVAALAMAASLFTVASAFLPIAPVFGGHHHGVTTRLFAAVDTEVSLSLSLTKPLGMILEEIEEGQAAGVFVKEVVESGSAAKYQDQILGGKISTVQGQDATALTFDSVMELIVGAPETVELQLLVKGPETEEPMEFAEGTVVEIKVKQDGKPDLVMNAKVGDNLRQTLLDNGFEVYQGLKQKLGNCGGAGQCTFCAVDFVESEGWLERSDYEDKKLRKNPDARLACLNSIQGPATIRKAQR